MPVTKKDRVEPISIFVSSTYKDLASCRAEVEKQLVGLEQAVKGMAVSYTHLTLPTNYSV